MTEPQPQAATPDGMPCAIMAGGGRDYFALFRLTPSPHVDEVQLSARKRQLQTQFHPDRFAGATATEKRLAATLSAEINAGFATLLDPVKRAGYLLEGVGIDLKTAERQPVDTAFLMEQMQLREYLADWSELDQTQQSTTREQAARLFDQQWQAFVNHWESGSHAGATDAWVRLQYVDKLRHEIAQRTQD